MLMKYRDAITGRLVLETVKTIIANQAYDDFRNKVYCCVFSANNMIAKYENMDEAESIIHKIGEYAENGKKFIDLTKYLE